MPTVAKITVLNIDDKPIAVDSLSEQVQSLVEMYNEWCQKEAEVRDELARFQAAKETLSRQIITSVKSETEEKVDEPVAVETPPPAE